MNRIRRLAFAVGIALLSAPPASALSLAFSDESSDTTPAEWLAASVSWTLLDYQTLEMAVRNDTSGDTRFDIMHLFFSAGPFLEYVELIGASSSVDGANTDAWRVGSYGYDLATARFGDFDFSLRTEPGLDAAHRVAPGETQTFVLGLSCNAYGACFGDPLDGWSEGGHLPARAAIRFAYGPNGDAAFGAVTTTVPEPRTAWLVAAGLAGLGRARRAG